MLFAERGSLAWIELFEDSSEILCGLKFAKRLAGADTRLSRARICPWPLNSVLEAASKAEH